MPEVLVQIEAGPPGPSVVERQVRNYGGEILKTGPEIAPPVGAVGKGALATRGDQYIAIIPFANGSDFNDRVEGIKDFPEEGNIRIWFYQGPDPRKPPWDKIALGLGIVGTVLGGAELVRRVTA